MKLSSNFFHRFNLFTKYFLSNLQNFQNAKSAKYKFCFILCLICCLFSSSGNLAHISKKKKLKLTNRESDNRISVSQLFILQRRCYHLLQVLIEINLLLYFDNRLFISENGETIHGFPYRSPPVRFTILNDCMHPSILVEWLQTLLIFNWILIFQRNGRLLRAKDLGLTPTANSSLEFNQSFPRLTRKLKSVSKVQFSKALLNTEDMNSVSFSTQATQSSFHPDNQSNIEDTLNISHFNEDAVFNPNPHKGVLTIDSKTSQVIKVFTHSLLSFI